jgi:hypothetical protein
MFSFFLARRCEKPSEEGKNQFDITQKISVVAHTRTSYASQESMCIFAKVLAMVCNINNKVKEDENCE